MGTEIMAGMKLKKKDELKKKKKNGLKKAKKKK